MDCAQLAILKETNEGEGESTDKEEQSVSSGRKTNGEQLDQDKVEYWDRAHETERTAWSDGRRCEWSRHTAVRWAE